MIRSKFVSLAVIPLVLTTLACRGADDSALPAEKPPAKRVETPRTLSGAVTFIYHDVEPEPMRLHVFKPEGWQSTDQRPAWIHFFGGGFLNGTPLQSAGQGRNAAKLGMVGIAVDYRVKYRHGTDASACVADARAALHWVQTHATELGIDPRRVVVSGSSAGGHLALWTAIGKTPWGSDPGKAPIHRPVALILMSAAADTSESSGQRSDRFAGHGLDLSPYHQLDAPMPPVLMFHGDADTVVPYRYAVALDAKLRETGTRCEFITVPGGSHSFSRQSPEWKTRVEEEAIRFLRTLDLVERAP